MYCVLVVQLSTSHDAYMSQQTLLIMFAQTTWKMETFDKILGHFIRSREAIISLLCVCSSLIFLRVATLIIVSKTTNRLTIMLAD